MNQTIHPPFSHATSALLLRATLGTVLLAHALLKIFSFGFAGTVEFFASIGLPAIAAHLTIAGEVLGGLALILGIFTRLAALLSLPIMLGATWVHLGNGWVFSNAGGGWEFPALLSVLSVIVFLQGAGSPALSQTPAFNRLLPAIVRS